MLRRLRFKNTTLEEEMLVEEAQRLREEVQGISPGFVRARFIVKLDELSPLLT
ncbi:hypothetical protein [Bradyrhizobium sp. DASA03007]|uniref:hypothetical protein n=1 Tax=unclassified Bradyrhizobium TaxID=2631580 RepID=UPI003F71F1A8